MAFFCSQLPLWSSVIIFAQPRGRTLLALIFRDTRMNIIGISAGYHDSACCLLSDGQLTAAVQEERLSRIKNDRSFPRRSFRSCLAQAGMSISDIDCVAYYEDSIAKLGRQIWMGLTTGISVHRRLEILDRLMRPQPAEMIRRVLGYLGPIEVFDHHSSHAASTFYFSGFDEAAVLTVDGVGDWPSTTYGYGRGTLLERFEQVDFPHSLGLFYSAITSYLGFEVNEGEYKVMGLAPYGNDRYVETLQKLVNIGPAGQYQLNLNYFAFLHEDAMYSETLCSELGRPARKPEDPISQFHMDVAKSAQLVLENILLSKVRYLHGRVPTDNLCMAGGVALNVVANRRCLAEGPFKRLFVQPAAADSGGALGAAALAHVRLTGHVPAKQSLDHVYWGPSNSSNDVYQLLLGSAMKFLDFRGQEDRLLRKTADYLLSGKVIGWCQGRMEFGPRALGARSILADARDPRMRDKINALVKKREAFRPFAPAVLESQAAIHFDISHPSPFMLETCRVISHIDLPAVTHIDGSARVQTVHPATNGRFAALLTEFYRLTGCPVLLNTSFNMRGEPIVCSALDAIKCFIRCEIDVLVIEDFILLQSDIPPLWRLQGREGNGPPNASIRHDVYTFL